MPVDVQVSDMLYSKLDEGKLTKAVKKAVTETTAKLERECVDYAPIDTGNLKRSFSHEVSGGNAVTRAQVKNSTNYWMYPEYGTRYQPVQGYIQRAVEVARPAEDVVARFQQYYKPDGGK